MTRLRLLLLLLLSVLLTPDLKAQKFSPYQVGAYYPGLVSLRDYTAAPPGFIVVDYNYWINSNKFIDRKGNQISNIEFDLLNGESINIDIEPEISGYANVPLFSFISKFTILGGAHYSCSVSPTFMNVDATLFVSVGDSREGVRARSSGFGDLSFMPLGLMWKFSRMELSFLYTIYAPTGRYEAGADDNLGQGFWTNQFQVPMFFYAMDQAFAFGLIPTLEINSKAQDVDARAGNRFTLEYGISQYFTDWLELEVMNGHNWQISDDTGSAIWWRGTEFDFRDRANNFSVGVNTWPLKDMINLRGKYTHDYGIRQGLQGSYWSLSVLFIFAAR